MKNIDVSINGNNIKIDNGTSVDQILSKKFLKMEKFDCSIEVNGKEVFTKDRKNSLCNGDSIIIKINGIDSTNLSGIKKYINNILMLVKSIKSYSNIIYVKILLCTWLNPYYLLKSPSLKFFTPNKKVFGRAKTALSSEPDTIEWINNFDKGDILLDIGANVGVYSLYAGTLGYHVVSVEPLWSNYSVLCDNIILNNLTDKIIPLNIALNDRTRIEGLSVSNLKAGASHNSIDDKVSQSAMINVCSSLKVMGCTIDFMWKNFDLPTPSHIKIDVDGIEERVIFGGKSLFNNSSVRSILVEVSILETDQCKKIIEFLTDIGFYLESVMGIKMDSIDFSKLSGMRGSGGTLNLIFYKI